MIEIYNTKYGRVMAMDNDMYLGRMLREYGEACDTQLDVYGQCLNSNMVAVDGGANIGIHTLVMAQKAGMVYSFEPQPHLYNILCGNLALNNVRNVCPIWEAVGPRRGRIKLPDLDYSITNNFGGLRASGHTTGNDILMRTIDFPCDFIKLDIEGDELGALQGAENTIRHSRPWIYVEADRADRFQPLVAFLRYLGYTPYWHITPLYKEDNWKKNPVNHYVDMVSFDILCAIPGRHRIDGLSPVGNGTWHEELNGLQLEAA